jgi:hypothetical protein
MIRRGESLRHCFYTAGADFFLSSVNFFSLQIDAEFSQCFNIGMADFVSG